MHNVKNLPRPNKHLTTKPPVSGNKGKARKNG